VVHPGSAPAGVDEELWALLEQFRGVLREAGAPVAENLAPGVAPEVVRARLGELGMEPSEQLLTWFAWQNGIADWTGPAPAATFIMVVWVPYSLDEAVEEWRMWDHGSEPWEWIPTWLPVAHYWGMPRLAVDCTPPQDRICTVRQVSPDAGLFAGTDAGARTLDWAVHHWIAMVENWGYHVDSGGGWDGPWNDMPLEDRLTGII
jgi:hypothetical protein